MICVPFSHAVPPSKKKRKVSRDSDEEDLSVNSVAMLSQETFDPDERADITSTDAFVAEAVSKNELKCNICGTEYQQQTLRFFKAHMAQHTCPMCKAVLPFKDMVKHVKHTASPVPSRLRARGWNRADSSRSVAASRA